ncbi:MAG: tripartite tricarboxylate transporter permease [Candidatus Thermoplasmatota archaeon]
MLVVLISLLGSLIGCFSGLLPGLHVNNLAVILVSLSPILLLLLRNPLLVSIIIVTISIAHTFVNLIPGTFLGAPDENALSILPAHKLLLEGNGYSAVFISSVGSFGAIVFGFAILLLFKFVMYELSFYKLITQFMVFILIAITIILIYSEHCKIPYKKGIAVENIKYKERSGNANIFKKLELGKDCSVEGLITKSGKYYFIENRDEKIPLECATDTKLVDGITATIEGTAKRVRAKFSRSLGVAVASSVFLLSGALGIIIFSINVSSPFNLPSTVLFPAFAGLFGISTLIFSVNSISAIPEQRLERPKLDKKSSFISILTGSTAGALLGFLPGITSGHATVLSMLGRNFSFKRRKKTVLPHSVSPEQTLLTLSAVNTSYSFFCIITLFVLGKARNGTALAIAQLTNIEKWTSVTPPLTFVYLLIGILIAGAVSYYVNIWLGKWFAKIFSKLPYRKLVIAIIVSITVIVFIFTGFVGLLILFVATAIGLIPLFVGIRRSHCMGLILLPVIIRLEAFLSL